MSREAAVRVAHCIDSFMIGGTELNAIRTLEALDRQRFEVTVFYLQEQGPLRIRYEALGVTMIRLTVPGFLSARAVREGVRFGMLVRRLGIQIVHAHDVYTNIFTAFWARLLGRCRIIASRRWQFEVPRPSLNTLNRWSYRFAHRVLANSGSVVRLLVEQEHISARKIVEIPNFLSDDAFEVDSQSQRLERHREWGIPVGAFVLGVVARLAVVKNQAMLLRALPELDDDTHVVLVGDGPERARLEELAAQLGVASRVHFTGTVLSRINLHQFFDVSVLCSHSEGFPNAVIEALAAQRPVVATRVGGILDVIEHGVTGLLIDAEDVHALAHSLRALRSDAALRAQLGSAGAKRVRERYGQQFVISKLENLYSQLAGEL